MPRPKLADEVAVMTIKLPVAELEAFKEHVKGNASEAVRKLMREAVAGKPAPTAKPAIRVATSDVPLRKRQANPVPKSGQASKKPKDRTKPGGMDV